MPVDSVKLSLSKHTIISNSCDSHSLGEPQYACLGSFLDAHAVSAADIFHSGYLSNFSIVFACNKTGQNDTAVFSVGVVEEAQTSPPRAVRSAAPWATTATTRR